MDIISIRRTKRNEIIESISKAIIKSIELSQEVEENYSFDYESILVATQARFNCTRRTAREYTDIALYKVGLTKSELTNEDKTKQMRLNINGK